MEVQNQLFQLESPLTVYKLVVYLMNWYQQTSLNKLKKSSLPLKPGALNRRLQHVVRIMRDRYPNFHNLHEMRLKQYVREFTVKLHAKFCLQTKQANPLSWPDARNLALKLWNATLTRTQTRTNSVLLRKAAALALMLGTATGARWGDLHRLRWEDISKVIQWEIPNGNCINILYLQTTLEGRKYIQIHIRHSKNNPISEIPQCYTIKQRPMEERIKCPIYWLQQYFKFRMRPTQGYIFAYPNGSPIDGSSTIKVIRTQCRNDNWPETKLPTKHSLRISMVLTLSGLKIPEDQINRFMMWKSPEMQHYYINRRDHMLQMAPANVIAILSDQRIAQIQNDLI